MLVIQGRNDPRVVAEESEDLVKHLQENGKDVELLLFENEATVWKSMRIKSCAIMPSRIFSERREPVI